MSELRKLRVFLSYAHEDILAVQKLYDYLQGKGFDVWLDKAQLIAGQIWRDEVEKALNSSDAVIICLSPISVSKEGYVQKEFRFALEKALEIPDGNIYLIPVRIKECEVPEKLLKYQYADLFENNGFETIERALNNRLLQIEKQEQFRLEHTVSINFSPEKSTSMSISQRIMLIIFNPIESYDKPSNSKSLNEQLNWYDPDDLANKFIRQIGDVSYGILKPQIASRFFVDDFPLKVDGFRYSNQEYLSVLKGNSLPHMPQEMDYQYLLNYFNIRDRINDNEVDEIWLFAHPHSGAYLSRMGGPGAFWCNAPPIRNTDHFKRRFVVMGFSSERWIGEMLHSYGLRAESIMEKVYQKTSLENNMFRKFTRYDRIAPGKAGCGTIHFAPNSTSDYEWNNRTMVKSNCSEWLNYPNLEENFQDVNCQMWGDGDIVEHHRWWFRHLPHVEGSLSGVANNWWYYIADPNNV